MGLGKGKGRPPDAKSKSHQILVKAKPEEEVELDAFKEICARNGISIKQEIFTRAIRPFLREHHWPPGNSQTLIGAFLDDAEKEHKVCDRCGKEAPKLFEAIFISGKKLKECSDCYENAKGHRLVKKFLRVVT